MRNRVGNVSEYLFCRQRIRGDIEAGDNAVSSALRNRFAVEEIVAIFLVVATIAEVYAPLA